MANVMLYLAWEYLIMLGAVTVLRFALSNQLRCDLAHWTAWLSVKLLLGCMIPMGLAFVQGLQPLVMLSVVAALALPGAMWVWKHRAALPPLTFTSWLDPRFIWIVPLLHLVLLSSQQVMEVDSRTNFDFLFAWIHQGKTPYHFLHNYVCLWESGYLPCVVLGQADCFFLWPNLQMLALMAMTGWLICQRLQVSQPITALLVLQMMVSLVLWRWVSGLATLKNDMAYNTGVLLLAASLLQGVRGQLSGIEVVLLAVGLSFSLSKYSGPPLALALGFIALIATQRGARLSLLKAGAIAAVVAMAASGHFFLRNLIDHGNPLWPIKVFVAGIELSGEIDLRGTAISDHLGEPAAWMHLLGLSQKLNATGCLAVLLVTGVVALVVNRFRLSREQACVGAFSAIGLMLFIKSYWSAGTVAEPLMYIESGGTWRYATAALFLGWLFMVTVALSGPKWLRVATISVVALDGLLRLIKSSLSGLTSSQALMERLPLLALWPVLILTVVGVIWAIHRSAPAARVMVILNPAWMIGLLAIGLTFNRAPVYGADVAAKVFATAPPMKLFQVSKVKLDGHDHFFRDTQLPSVGARFQHTVTSGDLDQLDRLLTSHPGSVDAVLVPFGHDMAAAPDAVVAACDARLRGRGFALNARSDRAAVFLRR